MMALAGVALVCGIDSLVVCFALGPLVNRLRFRFYLSLLFGLCDGVAAWVGGTLAASGGAHLLSAFPISSWFAPALICLYALGILWAAGNARRMIKENRYAYGALCVLPVLLSLDNLMGAVSLHQASPLSFGILCVVVSGGMALAGMLVGSILGCCVAGSSDVSSDRFQRSRAYCSGLALFGASIVLAVIG